MAYSATFWVNNSEPAITAEKLNKIEYGVASGHAIAESKASTDYVQGQVAAEVDARINYVDAAVNNLEQQIDDTNSNIVPVVYNEMLDTESSLSAIVDSKSITAVDTNFSLSTLTTNLATEFGENASNITTKLATYAQSEDVGAIAQVALDVNGRITGWTAVDSSVGGSAFRINADTFALADSTNEHVPFSIDAATGVTQFNGIVQFSNVSGTDDIVLTGDSISSLYNDSGFLIPSEVANAVNTNTTTINGDKITTGSISAAKIYSYNLTATNATFQNGMITNATIADAAITNAKISNASITTAKIDDAAITNAKIGTASVDTLKIAGEAVVVTRATSGSGTVSISYSPDVSHKVVLLASTTVGTNDLEYTHLDLNYSTDITARMQYAKGTEMVAVRTYNVIGGRTYLFSANGYYENDTESGTTNVSQSTRLVMMGAKR